MNNDNKGYSLLELIIVIALATILSSVAIYSISLVVGQDAKQCANNLSTALDKARTYAMTRSGASDVYMKITKESDGYYYVTYREPKKPHIVCMSDDDYKDIEKERIGKGMTEITFTVDGSTYQITNTNDYVKFTYDRTSGAFKKTEIKLHGAATTTVGYCKQIDIQRGKHYKLTLFSATGKHVLDRIG